MITAYDLYQQPLKVILAAGILLLWTLLWKGIGLWYAAQEKKKGWFLAILVLNTAGLLPIIYLIWFREKEKMKPQEETTEREELKAKKVLRKKAKKTHEENRRE
ncbi:hypothetical protein J4210_00455 [Candidatus Woesearchaeota archaeon]|nr:hypothetical protein [Candidatus Woesearchaeota archaeon]